MKKMEGNYASRCEMAVTVVMSLQMLAARYPVGDLLWELERGYEVVMHRQVDKQTLVT